MSQVTDPAKRRARKLYPDPLPSSAWTVYFIYPSCICFLRSETATQTHEPLSNKTVDDRSIECEASLQKNHYYYYGKEMWTGVAKLSMLVQLEKI